MTPVQSRGVAMAFDHEKLDVYQLAIDFVARANDIVENLPRGRGYLADQLQRAALSIVLNLAEGAGKFSPKDKAAFYLRARGSTITKSAASPCPLAPARSASTCCSTGAATTTSTLPW